MGDISRGKKVEDNKAAVVPPVTKVDPGIQVSWGNAERVKILLLQAINNNLIELLKATRNPKEDK